MGHSLSSLRPYTTQGFGIVVSERCFDGAKIRRVGQHSEIKRDVRNKLRSQMNGNNQVNPVLSPASKKRERDALKTG